MCDTISDNSMTKELGDLREIVSSKLIDNIDSWVCQYDENGQPVMYLDYSEDVKVCVNSDFETMYACVIYQPIVKEPKDFCLIASNILEEKDLSSFVPALKTLFNCFEFNFRCDPLYFVMNLIHYHYHSESKTPFLILPQKSFPFLSIDDPNLIKIEIFDHHCCKVLKLNE